ncbi:DUF4055 domain-containing protein [uncultured Ruegeria sp.]|uniref:DUF4055 domain-containing protein n=1 Tax=uncultured Ruegeria sp. TaxID=259304 RepID=UPI00260333DF|nr:DUF4055 domain-containing protein [uncultured Ruegeria sp.]
MAIDYHRDEYTVALPKWQLVNDMAAEDNLAAYLVELNPTDKSPENKARNEAYAERASFLGATEFTLKGLNGVAFEDDPSVSLPGALDYLLTNANGQGLDLYQQMQNTTANVLKNARSGLFVTYPATEGDTSRADQESNRSVATIHVVDASRIINWGYTAFGAEVKLSLLVFTDTIETFDDYEVKTEDIIRELALEDGLFVDRKWHKPQGKGWEVFEASEPLQGNGERWDTIPFSFVGAEDNSERITTPPLYSLAKLNRDHWRTSADHRESLWFAGQVQPWASGVDESTLETWQKAGIYVGSRNMLCLPEGGQFGFGQSDPNTANRDELDRLKDDMATIGARFIEPGSANKTAQQDAGERKVQHSILSLISVNVEDAYQQACEWAANYMNADGDVEVSLSREFMQPELNDAARNYILGLYDRGLIGDEDMLPILKRDKLVDAEKTGEEFSEEVGARSGGVTDAVDA